jgi:hypothetical protein
MVDENLKAEVRSASESDAVMLAQLRYELRSSLHGVVENDVAFIERCTSWMQEATAERKQLEVLDRRMEPNVGR